MPGQQVSNSCVASSRASSRRVVIFVLGQRDTAMADDGDCAHLFVWQILGVLKKGNCSIRLQLSWPLNHSHCSVQIQHSSLLLVALNGKANSDGTPITVIIVRSIVYYGRSQLYTSVTQRAVSHACINILSKASLQQQK